MAKIVVVEDSVFQRQHLKTLLEELGHEVLTASDGKEALEAIGSRQPDGFIVDLLMPVMNGLEMLQALQRLKSELPVIVMTADAQESTRKKCLELGVSEFVNKPVSPQSLSEALSQAGLA